MLVEIAWRVARMRMMLPFNLFLLALVAVTFRIEIAWRMTGVVMMLTWHFLLPGGVAMSVRVQIPRRVARMIVMRAGLFFSHFHSPCRSRSEKNARASCSMPSSIWRISMHNSLYGQCERMRAFNREI